MQLDRKQLDVILFIGIKYNINIFLRFLAQHMSYNCTGGWSWISCIKSSFYLQAEYKKSARPLVARLTS